MLPTDLSGAQGLPIELRLAIQAETVSFLGDPFYTGRLSVGSRAPARAEIKAEAEAVMPLADDCEQICLS
jgi:hypothetical protein